jgi:hypothetical protein
MQCRLLVGFLFLVGFFIAKPVFAVDLEVIESRVVETAKQRQSQTQGQTESEFSEVQTEQKSAVSIQEVTPKLEPKVI